jgi:ribosomal protein S18 acetylase RimI-like enzyme
VWPAVHSRPATRDDLAALVDLQARVDLAWFGAVEQDEDEVREFLDRIDDLQHRSRVVLDDGRLVAAAFWEPNDAQLLVDPDIAPQAVHAELIAWFARRPTAKVVALARDEALRAALVERGWTHTRSSFDLLRPVTDDWELPAPSWPASVTARGLDDGDAAAVHTLIYEDAAWAEVPGHPYRDLAEWKSIFLTDTVLPEQQVLAWRGEQLIGAAMGRTFSDGTGWVSQLAVATGERGRGLGRALLLEALRRRRAGGATALGLSVQADNRGALGLYLDVGLAIDREWMEYRPG